MTTAAVIVAAGRGTRAGGGCPSSGATVGGLTLVARTLAAFRRSRRSSGAICLVLHPDDMDLAAGYAGHAGRHRRRGRGDPRAAAVRAGLEALARRAARPRC